MICAVEFGPKARCACWLKTAASARLTYLPGWPCVYWTLVQYFRSEQSSVIGDHCLAVALRSEHRLLITAY